MDDATRLFTKVFFTLTGSWADTYSFRRVVDLGLPSAAGHVIAQNTQWLTRFVLNPTNDAIFIDKAKFLQTNGGPEALAARMTAKEMSVFRGSVDAASLVFMHFALDGAVHDLCRATALVAPTAWELFIDDQKERLADVRAKGYEALAKERLDRYIAALSRETMVKKTDRLFQVPALPR
jgi:hypothetical protein